MDYKPDKKVKIKGMRKIKHLSKPQVDVLVLMLEGDVIRLHGEYYGLLEDGDKNIHKVSIATLEVLLVRGMIEEIDFKLFAPIKYRRTKAADEYLLKYHRNRIKDFI